MARYKEYDYSQGKFMPIHFDKQIIPGTFEHSWIVNDKIHGKTESSKKTFFYRLASRNVKET